MGARDTPAGPGYVLPAAGRSSARLQADRGQTDDDRTAAFRRRLSARSLGVFAAGGAAGGLAGAAAAVIVTLLIKEMLWALATHDTWS